MKNHRICGRCNSNHRDTSNKKKDGMRKTMKIKNRSSIGLILFAMGVQNAPRYNTGMDEKKIWKDHLYTVEGILPSGREQASPIRRLGSTEMCTESLAKILSFSSILPHPQSQHCQMLCWKPHPSAAPGNLVVGRVEDPGVNDHHHVNKLVECTAQVRAPNAWFPGPILLGTLEEFLHCFKCPRDPKVPACP